jgi:hypothetical protein
LIIEIEEQVEDARDQMHEHQAHLEALENGETFVPTLKKNKSVSSKKRKSTGKIKQGPAKRRRSVASDADEEEDELMESDEDFSESSDGDSDVDGDDSDHENAETSGGEPDSSEVEDEEITNLTENDLKEKVQEAKDTIKVGRDMLKNAQTAKKEAIDALSSVEKGHVKIQREKNAFCSLKRSEVSRNSFNLFVNNKF